MTQEGEKVTSLIYWLNAPDILCHYSLLFKHKDDRQFETEGSKFTNLHIKSD